MDLVEEKRKELRVTDLQEEAYDYDMRCEKPIRIFKNLDKEKYPDGLEVPCGKCLLCRVAKRSEWTMRCLHELSDHEDSIFITLTYSDEFIPENMSLDKKGFQKFIKRLRKSIEPKKIRYFACGEYGDQTQRPHYHVIVFGLSLLDVKIIKDAWPFGIVHAGLAEADSIRYVAQYIDKKWSGDKAKEEYEYKNREMVFKVSSLGIGRKYCDTNSNQFIDRLVATVNGVTHALPRYYVNRLGLSGSNRLHDYSMDKEKDVTEYYTGQRLTADEAYRLLPSEKVITLERGKKQARSQSCKNLEARSNLKKRKL